MVFNEEIAVIESLPSPCPRQSSSSSDSSSLESTILLRHRFIDVVKKLCSQLALKMTQKNSKIKDLKQVAPLQVPKEETDHLEPVLLGDTVLLRKTSANSKVTVYMPKIEFEDLGCLTEPVEGIVTYDETKLEPGEKVYIALVGRFRYGREEDEILGMSLCREIYMGYMPVCSIKRMLSPQGSMGSNGSPHEKLESLPGPSSGTRSLVQTQKSLSEDVLRSSYSIQLSPFHDNTLPFLPPESVPFRFEFPEDAPISMVMQRLTPESGDTCGVRYYVRCYTSLEAEEQQTTISLLNFPIKKVQYASLARSLMDNQNEGLPKGTILKEFPLNGGSLSLEATLNKSLYEHGEEIRVKIHVTNSSHKTIKHVKVSVLQVADICLFSTGKWKVCVATTNNRNDCPISSGNSIEQEVVLLPKVGDNKHKYGVFVQSRSGPEPDCLASSTIFSEEQRKNLFGIVVDYEVKVKLCLGTLSSLSGRGEIACFIPFQIHHTGPASLPLPGQSSLPSNGDLRVGSAVEQMEQLNLERQQ